MSLTECATPAVDTSDHRIVSFRELSAPAAIRAELPLTPRRARAVQRDRDDIAAILAGADDRLLLVVGPCSVHDPVAALDYARRLAPIAAEFADRLKIVMRVYFEKPRTTIGWKGLINDPAMDGSFDVERGIRTARALLLDIIDVGMPVGCEFLEPTSPQYIADAVAWGAIGARTTESQVHRQLASGLSMPIGFKNGTDGNVQVAIDGVKAAAAPHHFFGTDDVGRAAVVETMGNPDCHVILRGGTAGQLRRRLGGRRHRTVKCGRAFPAGHGRLLTRQLRQGPCAASRSRRRTDRPHRRRRARDRGLMLESFLVAGAQPLGGELTYGQSVTDECMDFATTARLLAGLYAAMG